MIDYATDCFAWSNRARLTAPALRSFFAIADAWSLTADEQMRLLGLESRTTLRRWRQGGVMILSREKLERISYVLGVYKSLQILLPEADLAHAWIRQPDAAPLFGGRSALDRMLGGNVADLFVVRQYLDGQIGDQ